MVLIEKEWISFGHKFFLRIGHGDKNESEQSPVFLQFLDCTYQLIQQFESAFEFNETFLLKIADYLYSCQYGTFLLNSEKVRVDMKISEYTMSAWTPMLEDHQIYTNKFYNEKIDLVLRINCSSEHIKLWNNYYCRYMSDHQSTSDNIIHRTSTLLHLRNKLNPNQHDDESSQPRSRSSSYVGSGTQYPNPSPALRKTKE
ncbi:unnamed protein product [Adineta steineri]|nr:unnamed protein product [Adineta steineri]